MVTLTVDDLRPFTDEPSDRLTVMIRDVTALAVSVAPCLTDNDLPEYLADAARAHMRAAVLRWIDAGTGAVQTQTMGPFSQSIDTTQRRRGTLWPSEIHALQDICRQAAGQRRRQAFTVNRIAYTSLHAGTCPETPCTCGQILTI